MHREDSHGEGQGRDSLLSSVRNYYHSILVHWTRDQRQSRVFAPWISITCITPSLLLLHTRKPAVCNAVLHALPHASRRNSPACHAAYNSIRQSLRGWCKPAHLAPAMTWTGGLWTHDMNSIVLRSVSSISHSSPTRNYQVQTGILSVLYSGSPLLILMSPRQGYDKDEPPLPSPFGGSPSHLVQEMAEADQENQIDRGQL